MKNKTTMTNSTVPISVILPVYNGEDHLTVCIESVLAQTFQDFEFIIVNDASTDGTSQILNKFASIDKRIKIINNKVNQKQTASANTAIKNSKGKYLARMDADDVALPSRFEKQINVLEDNPDIGAIGSSVDLINSEGEILRQWNTHPEPDFLKWFLMFGASLPHSSVMMRRKIIEEVGGYKSVEAEDYDLWSRVSRVAKVANISEVLQQKRLWEGQLGKKVPIETIDCSLKIMQSNMHYLLGFSAPLKQVKNIRFTMRNICIDNKTDIVETVDLILVLTNTFLQSNSLDKYIRAKVKKFTAQKLHILAEMMRSKNLLSSFTIYYKILILNPKYLINVGIRQGFKPPEVISWK